MKKVPSVLRKARANGPAQTRNAYANPGAWLQPQSQAGIYVSPDTALNLAAVFAAVNIISTDGASLPCLTYRQLDDGGKVINMDDPLFDLLFWEPNNELDSFHFVQTIFSHALTSGNGYGEITRFQHGLRAGDPAEIHLIDHKEINPARDRNNRLIYELADGKILRPSDVLHLRGLSHNGIVGISPTTRARQTIGLGQAAEIFGATYFGNGAHAAGFLKTKGKLSEESKDTLLEQHNIRHAGPYASNKTGVLVGDWEWIQTGLSPEDSQFLATRQFTVVEIARWYNINPIKLMDFTNGNFSNVETLTLDYISTTLLPWLINWERELARKLLPRWERRVRLIKHDVEARLRGDSAARVAYYRGLFDIGVLSQNDIRRAENMNPIAGGNTYYIPGNNMVPSGNAEVMPYSPLRAAKSPARAELVDLALEQTGGRL